MEIPTACTESQSNPKRWPEKNYTKKCVEKSNKSTPFFSFWPSKSLMASFCMPKMVVMPGPNCGGRVGQIKFFALGWHCFVIILLFWALRRPLRIYSKQKTAQEQKNRKRSNLKVKVLKEKAFSCYKIYFLLPKAINPQQVS